MSLSSARALMGFGSGRLGFFLGRCPDIMTGRMVLACGGLYSPDDAVESGGF